MVGEDVEGVRVLVGGEGGDGFGGGRETGEDEVEPADERARVGGRGGGETFLLETVEDEGVDWVSGAGGFRWRGSGERLEGPEIAAIGDERRERVAGGGEERGGGEGSEQRDEDRGVHGWGKGRGGWSVSYSRA